MSSRILKCKNRISLLRNMEAVNDSYEIFAIIKKFEVFRNLFLAIGSCLHNLKGLFYIAALSNLFFFCFLFC